ncbi:MAG: erythrose-4-phosphate dehydrogenase [Gammaproteobacteria bacterium CG22_combo_CG10-13_8_21_14_all_40_8]|nr:MAG: erythrose-4-phosphate dehydrogenase [Gammaproteobacteria bacterium CG22_combo_CG10-13_8_21_14_all_40_8]
MRIAINGFGRIGRSVLRAIFETHQQEALEVVAINELAESQAMVHLLQYDSTHGKFHKQVELEIQNHRDFMRIDGKRIEILSEPDSSQLPWKELGIDLVLDCSGKNDTRQKAQNHINSGAKKVLLSQPPLNPFDATIIMGYNHLELKPEHQLVSNASCSSNCLVPVLSILEQAYGVASGNSTTIHAAMSDQPINDSYANSLHRSRAAMQSVIPVSTTLSLGIVRFFPHLKNKFESLALRVPTTNVSLIDVSLQLKTATTLNEVHHLLKSACETNYQGIVDFCETPLVSIDFNHDPHSAIIDSSQTRLCDGTLLKLILWFDNEWGFANRMVDTAKKMFEI